MLQDLHKKMENQKEAKKSSTAIEELIFQVKEVGPVYLLFGVHHRMPVSGVCLAVTRACDALDQYCEHGTICAWCSATI